MTPVFLSSKIPWFGNHSGYEQLPRYVQKLNPGTKVIGAKVNLKERALGKAYSYFRGWPARNQSDAAAEFRFARANGVPDPVKHILYVEDHLLFLDRWQKAPRHFVGTIHIPPMHWTREELSYLPRLSSAIVLYQRDLDYFESKVGQGRVKFIRHGVDVDFFRPKSAPPDENKILFTGHFLRNTPMLARIIARLSDKHRDLQFHLLVPEEFRHLDGFADLKGRPSVVWHQKVSDDDLRGLICSSKVLLLPMNDSGANTAIVESLACGTPIVTTDVGGIRDYGGGSVFPVVANNDDDAMVALMEKYLDGAGWRNEIGARCREFAVNALAWQIIAQQHLEAYETLAR